MLLIIIHVLIITHVTDNYSCTDNSPYTDNEPYKMITFITKYHFLKSSFYIEKATDFYLFCQPSINSFAREFIFLQMRIPVKIKSKYLTVY